MTPAEFPHHDVFSVFESLAYIYRVVSALAVVLGIFFFSCDFCSLVMRRRGRRRSTYLGFLVGKRRVGGIGAVRSRSEQSRFLLTIRQATEYTNPELFIFTALTGLDPALCWSSVVMMGFRSWPFLRFLPPLPFAALFAAVATCFALLIAAFFISLPFILGREDEAADSRVLMADELRYGQGSECVTKSSRTGSTR